MKHPRFVFHHPPVHCSWMNQVEQWFSILQRKRLKIADFADKKASALNVPSTKLIYGLTSSNKSLGSYRSRSKNLLTHFL